MNASNTITASGCRSPVRYVRRDQRTKTSFDINGIARIILTHIVASIKRLIPLEYMAYKLILYRCDLALPQAVQATGYRPTRSIVSHKIPVTN